MEQVRKLIESDEVLLVFNALGTPTQTARAEISRTPRRCRSCSSPPAPSKWNDPKAFPWTMGFQPSYRVEARIFAKYILQNKPDAKVGGASMPMTISARTTSPGLKDVLRRQGFKMHRGRGELRDQRSRRSIPISSS